MKPEELEDLTSYRRTRRAARLTFKRGALGAARAELVAEWPLPGPPSHLEACREALLMIEAEHDANRPRRAAS
jgi:hypothetical protein